MMKKNEPENFNKKLKKDIMLPKDYLAYIADRCVQHRMFPMHPELLLFDVKKQVLVAGCKWYDLLGNYRGDASEGR